MQDKVISVIRSSLQAANAALDLLVDESVKSVVATQEPRVYSTVEVAQPVTETVVEAVSAEPVATEIQETPAEEALRVRKAFLLAKGAAIEADMEASRYNLRTLTELAVSHNVAQHDVAMALGEADVNYVTRTRRSDSAPLIGLAHRN